MSWIARAAAAVALAGIACAGARKPAAPQPKLNRWGKPYKEGIRVPPWVEKVPENAAGKLLAVGYAQPTFWPQDAIDAAAADARGKLALALTSHVEVLGIDTSTGSAGNNATITKEAADVLLRNSRIEATWVDENGDRGEPDGVWALASLQLDSVRGGRQVEPAAVAAPRRDPAWLERLPTSTTRVYAAGYSGPTYHPDDARRYAADDAIANLAASLRAHVQAYTLLVENASGLTLDQFSRTLDDPDGAFVDIVRKNAKIEETWVDAEGTRPGDPPGAVWALASIEVQSTKGAAKAVGNDDVGPALDRKGNAPEP